MPGISGLPTPSTDWWSGISQLLGGQKQSQQLRACERSNERLTRNARSERKEMTFHDAQLERCLASLLVDSSSSKRRQKDRNIPVFLRMETAALLR